jgi:hypothetical protein
MNLPTLSQPSLEPLTLLFENLIEGLDRFAGMNLDGQSRDVLLELRSLLTDEKTKCLETLPGEFSKMIAEYEQVKKEYNDLETSVFPGINSQLNDLEAALESASNSKPSVPALEKSEPSPGPILNSGEVLKENLLHRRNQDADLETRHQRTSGNIWENWKKPGQ